MAFFNAHSYTNVTRDSNTMSNNKSTELVTPRFLKTIGVLFTLLFTYNVGLRIFPPKSCEEAKSEYADVMSESAKTAQKKSDDMLSQRINGTASNSITGLHVPPEMMEERKKAYIKACSTD